MIKYRIFRHEPSRATIDVEYGDAGSGVTETIDLRRVVPPGAAVTARLLHAACVRACPLLRTEAEPRRIADFGSEDLAAIKMLVESGGYFISDEEEEAGRLVGFLPRATKTQPSPPRSSRIPVLDTTKDL